MLNRRLIILFVIICLRILRMTTWLIELQLVVDGAVVARYRPGVRPSHFNDRFLSAATILDPQWVSRLPTMSPPTSWPSTAPLA